jgi:hypothetical protein
MKNLHLIPTEKQNIYITNSEEIKEGDWFFQVNTKKRIKHHSKNGLFLQPQSFDKKIILTTDQSLDGVQAIDDKFLEWFIKNPNCEEVDVYDWMDTNGNIAFNGDIRYQISCSTYNKIIIPQEEPKQEEDEIIDISDHDGIGNAVDNLNNEPPQETLEEAAENYVMNESDATLKLISKYSFKDGAKWQTERMYSEKDMKQFAFECVTNFLSNDDNKVEIKLVDVIIDRVINKFEQFKKK